MDKTIYSARSEIFVRRIIELRKAANHTQRTFAKILDVPRSMISRIELGERRIDVIEYVEILQTLGVEPREEFKRLMDLIEEKPDS